MTDQLTVQLKAGGLPMPACRIAVLPGQTVEQILEKHFGSSENAGVFIRGHGIQWDPLPRKQWRNVKPKINDAILITHTLQGPGNKKAVFATIAMIALTIAAPYLAGPAGLGFIAGTLTHTIATAAITIGGSLAIQALFPSDRSSPQDFGLPGGGSESGTFSDVTTDSNVLGKEAYLPLVVGQRRISPPDIVQPRTYLENGVQVLERLQALDGPHLLSDPHVDRSPTSDFDAITTQITDGKEATGTYTFVDKISVPVQISEQLVPFNLDGVDLTNQDQPADSEPGWIHFATPDNAFLEEINIRLKLDSFYKSDSATQEVRVPLRIQFRAKGTDTWDSFPEIHIVGRNTVSKLLELRIRWDGIFGDATTGGEFDYEFWQQVPPVTDHVLSDGSEGADQWQAHDLFSRGPGYTDSKHIQAQRHYIRVDFNETTFPKGAYEWRVKRGWATTDTGINSSYSDGSNVVSMFLARYSNDLWQIPQDQGSFIPSISVIQATAIANEQPCQWPETSLIAYKSKGQSFRNASVLAARYINDWDGSAWATETATSKNPASHYRQLLYDYLVFNGYDTDLIAESEFVAWRQECIDRGYECNAVFAGETILEALSALATAGFARPRISEGFGIDYFRDRSSEIPAQTFSLRNTSNISFEIGNESLPAGFRVKFDNEEDSFKPDELVVTNELVSMFRGMEALSYKAITKPSLIERRGTFDLLQKTHRKRIWTVGTSLEGFICELGDLVSVVSDLFDDESQGVRIRQVIDDIHITIDQLIDPIAPPNDLTSGSPPDVADIFNAGERSIIFVTTPSGVVQRTIIGAENNLLRLDEALPGTSEELQEIAGTHANITTLSNAEHRCFVVGIERTNEENSRLTLVDEAPEIYEHMHEKYG